MSSRALKRLQKDQLLAVNDNDSEEEEIEQKPVKKFNPFDLLNEGEEEEEEEEEVIEEEHAEPEIKKLVNQEKSTNSSKPSTKKKKSKKNKKGKKSNGERTEENKKDTEDISMRELDKVIQEMSKKSSGKTNHDIRNQNTETRRQLLSVNHRFLDAEAEMKRLFGSHVVNSENRAHGRVLKKSKLTSPKPEWPPYKRNGLSMELIETVDGVSYFGYRHSEAYQDNQLEFLNAVSTHNPDALVFLIRRYPYHVDTLLQLSEIAKHSGDWVSAGDFIERALYACERALHPQFSMSTGTARLSFKRSENRSFFLAIFRHVQFLARRGCWRTAFEFNKLLFALDPIHDPLGSLLTLDHFALIAHEYDYVVKMYQEWKTEGDLYPVDLSNLPNFAFSAAYAQFKLNGDDSLIQQAIDKFPVAHQLLLEKLDKPTEQHSGHVFLNALQTIYAERSFELFKEPEVLSWLLEHHHQQDISFSPKDLKCKANGELPQNIARFLLLVDNQRLLALVPSKYTSQSYQMYDPLPPSDSETMYDINERMRSSSLRSFPTDVREIVDGLQQIWRQGQGRLPPEALGRLRQMMTELVQTQQQEGDQIPGTFPQDDSVEEEDNEHEQNDLHHVENEMLNDQEMTAEEMAEIMNAVSDDELEIQRALAEAYQRRQE
ncbi:hypothetical protein G6F57_005797 [Rhizopus arrhizus]|nr:hypothetical protein G6F24_000142 [Rhizopus arrhizus]KAG1399619.1 hypothetical protein G6F58_011095 [Rhizopus delemar]KAG0781114.1 hypothetical protein G6F22_009730 [Rhizopus arrhizus]KAG0797352.1 hypothetical protein G6F21_000583 [Rhizopus arrhizus]KAG0820053.1 hypothetical protein G6F20_000250 [Rhizopus arrhizus]